MTQTNAEALPPPPGGDALHAAIPSQAPRPEPETLPAEAPRTPGQDTGRAKAPTRLYALDGLRVLAALSVMLFHYTGIDGASPTVWGANPKHLFPTVFRFTKYGSLGVQLFFIISGFVICMSAWNRTPGQFVKARFLRLFPAYWFSIIVAYTLWHAVPDHNRTPPSTSDSLMNLSMFQVPMGARHLVGSYWTLYAELLFYLVFLLVLTKKLDFQRVYVFCWGWLVTSMLFQQPTGLQIVSTLAPAINTALFVAGITMYLMYRFGADLKLWLLLGASWLSVQQDMSQHTLKIRHQGLHENNTVVIGLITLFYLLILAVALHKLDWVSWRWLTVAGASVYPLYLLHEELGFALIRHLRLHMGTYPTLATTVVLVLALSYVVQRWVERPAYGWLRKRL
ncbi:acyltransferase family protein [Streptomyces sp. NRRL F-5123]|uniref:acyltransferase family protein n=1 Tax=Streptomyces sp. NRRL F-5123 TaxID=1463856 RepID=UPI00099E00A8|nr:acyltransferase [Streptomyces sp. NRRL F-5123]